MTLTHKNSTVVISTWNGTKSVAWKRNLEARMYRVVVYGHVNKRIDPRLNIPKNRGKEASVYLKFICDHYEDLTKYTIFLHDEELSWHHVGQIWKRVLEGVPEQQAV